MLKKPTYLHFQYEYQGQFTLVEPIDRLKTFNVKNSKATIEFKHNSTYQLSIWLPHKWRITFFFFFHSIPNVEDSSMAKRSFSRRTLAEGYGGKSNRLKQVCALWEKFSLKLFENRKQSQLVISNYILLIT